MFLFNFFLVALFSFFKKIFQLFLSCLFECLEGNRLSIRFLNSQLTQIPTSLLQGLDKIIADEGAWEVISNATEVNKRDPRKSLAFYVV